MATTNEANEPLELPTTATPAPSYSPATQSIHADDHLAQTIDIAPPMHVSTTFRYSTNPAELVPSGDEEAVEGRSSAPEAHVYSRVSAPSASRVEAVLSTLLHGHALTYASGLSAFHAMLVYLNPKHIAIGGGYHGCHGVIDVVSRLTGLKRVDLHDVAGWDAAGLGAGDVVHVETPLNPTGEAYNLEYYAAEAHRRGAHLSVDATFGPPGLQDPFAHGADVVMHSATKYMAGHSDMLAGVLAVRRPEWWRGLFSDRIFLGAVMGSFEGWLGLRSLRTMELRVRRQSENATRLVAWLEAARAGTPAPDGAGSGAGVGAADPAAVEAIQKSVLRVQHASLQADDMEWLRRQMPNGYGAVFAVWMRSREMARRLPSKLHLFHHATSLGGVESLIEWRLMSDAAIDPRVLRVSVGVEDLEDLKRDLLEGFNAVLKQLE